MKVVKVKGMEGLARDKESGAILNINKNEMEAARLRKQARKKAREQKIVEQEKVTVLEKRLHTLEGKLDTIIASLTLQQEK